MFKGIRVKYEGDKAEYVFPSFKHIILDIEKIVYIACDRNELSDLPENMYYPNLKKFYCDYNDLSTLPCNMNFPELEIFSCCGNNLRELPENMCFPKLQELYCSNNEIVKLTNLSRFPNIRKVCCIDNNLTELPGSDKTVNTLTELICYNNNIFALSENLYFPNLETICLDEHVYKNLPKKLILPKLKFARYKFGYDYKVKFHSNLELQQEIIKQHRIKSYEYKLSDCIGFSVSDNTLTINTSKTDNVSFHLTNNSFTVFNDVITVLAIN